MSKTDAAREYWRLLDIQDWKAFRRLFAPDAIVRWHNTREQFSAEEFVRLNSDYPEQWTAGVMRALDLADGGVVTVAKITHTEGTRSYHAVSFFTFDGERILSIDEYWGDDGEPPAWRRIAGLGNSF